MNTLTITAAEAKRKLRTRVRRAKAEPKLVTIEVCSDGAITNVDKWVCRFGLVLGFITVFALPYVMADDAERRHDITTRCRSLQQRAPRGPRGTRFRYAY